MRETLRKAGQKLLELDDAYSGKIVDMYMGPKDSPRAYTDNPVLGAAAGMAAVFAGGSPVRDIGRKGATAAERGAAVSSAAAKYVAPAVGAGVALAGLTAAFGSSADYPEEQQLTLQ